MVISPGQFHSDLSLGLYLHALTPEAQLGVHVAVEDEMRAVGVEGGNGRVVRHLLGHGAELRPLQLVRLSQ